MRRLILSLTILSINCSVALQSALAAPTSKMLVEAAEFTGLTASPDGRFLAFRVQRASVERNDWSSEWRAAPIGADKAPWRIADGGPPLRQVGYPTTELPQWSPDSRFLYFRALREGSVQVWKARRDGGGERAVTNDEADVIAFRILDGARLVYETGAARAEIEAAEAREFDQGILIDERVPVGRPLFRSTFINGRLASDRYTGDWLLTGGLLANADRRFRTVELDRGKTRAATADEIEAFERARDGGEPALEKTTRARGFQASRNRIAYRTVDGTELRAQLKGGDGAERVCADPSCSSVSWFAWRPDRDEILFASREKSRGGAHSLYLWDVETGVVRLVLESAGALYGGEFFHAESRCAVAADAAICVAAEANDPPRLERIDLVSGARRIMFEPNKTLSESSGPAAEALTWRDAAGVTFTGQFFPAAGARPDGPSPLFVTYYYCGGYLRGGVGDEWPLAAFADGGIAVLCIDRPTIDSLSAIDDYRTALSGITAAIDLLAPRGVDRKRIGMGGFSFGAEIAMWTAMRSDLLAAASIASPTLSETYFRQRSLMGAPFDQAMKTRWGLGDPAETAEQWRVIGAQHNLAQIDAPILMQFPEEEYLASIDYFAPLARRGAPVEMHVFPHEPHYKFLPRHKLAVYERNLDWFRFWLLNEEDAEPAKSNQYERWRSMKAAESQKPPNSR